MRRLLIFLKYPRPGQVKTRLAAALGDDAACQVYRACAELTLSQLGAFQRDAFLCVDPPDTLADTQEWLGCAWAMRPQHGATLGERLAEATTRSFAEGARRVVVIGTDSPWLGADDVTRAFAGLEAADVVLGPTDDGGYYLVGLARPIPTLFEAMAWSSPQVYRETQAKVHALGLRLETLPQRYDLDYLEDVQRFVRDARAHGARSSAVDTIERLSHRRLACPS